MLVYTGVKIFIFFYKYNWHCGSFIYREVWKYKIGIYKQFSYNQKVILTVTDDLTKFTLNLF